MQATFRLPEKVIHELEALAAEQGTTPDTLVHQLIVEHIQQHSQQVKIRQEARLPLISVTETGPIRKLYGCDLDDIFACEDRSS